MNCSDGDGDLMNCCDGVGETVNLCFGDAVYPCHIVDDLIKCCDVSDLMN